ncbi:MAG: CatA-like O-acetyltransferase [Candidatus Coproplasma sp.]
MKIIDVENWKRRIPYENFIKYTNPIFSLSTRLDVTELYASCKRRGTSFFTDFTFIAATCLNSVEEFRLRIKGGNVVLYEEISPSYIVMSDGGVIVSCRSQIYDDYSRFYRAAREDIERAKLAKQVKAFNDGLNDVYYISCMPWVDLTSFSNPYDLKDVEASSIPRLTWGKFSEENGRKKMTMDIAAHHALIDGEPVCRGFIAIQQALNDPDKFFSEHTVK